MGHGASRNDNAYHDYALYIYVTEGIVSHDAELRLIDAIDRKIGVVQWYGEMNARYGENTAKVIREVVEKVRKAAEKMKTVDIISRARLVDMTIVFLRGWNEILYYIFMDYFVKTHVRNGYTETEHTGGSGPVSYALRRSLLPLSPVRRDAYDREWGALIMHLSDLLYGTPEAEQLLRANARDTAPPAVNLMSYLPLAGPGREDAHRADRQNRD